MRTVVLSGLVLGLTACSGGGGGSTPTPTPTPTPTSSNSAPNFSDASLSATVQENDADTFLTLQATDADGDTLTYSVSGTDATAFAIDAATGDLRFSPAPDFEAPTDSGANNVYDLQGIATDPSGESDSLDIEVTVENVNETSGTRLRDLVYESVQVQRDITFATVTDNGAQIDLLMDIYTPDGDTNNDRPVMIVFSGGGFVAQDRENVEPIAEDFAKRGYIGVTADYRVLNSNPLSADELAIGGIVATHDLFAAVRFLRADAQGPNTYGIDPDAIFVSGESAGGVMAAIAAVIDPTDTFTSQGVSNYIAANGGVYGSVGPHTAIDATIQGAMPLSGAVLELAHIDANSAVIYAAHDEFDPVVPCETASEGSSFTGLVVSGACDIETRYDGLGLPVGLFLIAGSAGHVSFNDAQREEIYQNAATLFYDTVINAGGSN